MSTYNEEHRTPGMERREFPRTRGVRACKVQDLRSGKFIPAKTRDTSAGGVMIESHWPTNIAPGDCVAVYLASNAIGETVLHEAYRTPARVVRVLRGDAVILAIAFDEAAGTMVKAAA